MKELLSRPWPWYVAGPLIGLMVPLLLILGNKSFGISASLRHICAACIPTNAKYFQYDWGNYKRSYQFILNKKFIEVRNKSIYPPSKENPKGEIHEDIGYISYDKARKTYNLRQFHIEGFVNQYRIESIMPEGKTIVFISESIENIPSGWRAKESYQFTSEREFIESFEMASPGKEFEIYSKATLKRVN